MTNEKVARIRALNDRLRRTGVGGMIMQTSGVHDLGEDVVTHVAQAVMKFDDFTANNDPYQEHDFGAVEVDKHRIFWKIDYYGNDMESGSPDPADPSITKRVLTIMLASEY